MTLSLFFAPRRSNRSRLDFTSLHRASLPIRLRLRALVFVIGAMLAGAALRADMRITDARCEYAAAPLGIDVPQPRLSWRLSDEARGQRQTAYQVLVARSLDTLAADRGDLWDSGRVESSETTHVRYAGAALASSRQVFWKVRAWERNGTPTAWSEPASWTMGVLDPTEWRARWIAAPWSSESVLLRHEFKVAPGLRRAVLHVSGLGHYEATLNGAKVGDDLFTPGWTYYDATVLYDTYDVTVQLQAGANALGLTLGNGMYHVVRRNRFAKFTGSFGPLRAIVQLELDYGDHRETVTSSDAWRVHRGGITYNSIYGGEDFDARLQPTGWDRAGFDAGRWARAVDVVRPSGVLRGHSHASEPLRVIETRPAVALRPLAPGVLVCDFGQNASFVPRLQVAGPAGATVRLTPGEVLQDNGSIDRATMGGAHRGASWWQYTKATDGLESWTPKFFYTGSRYLYVELFPPDAEPGSRAPDAALPVGTSRYTPAQPGPERLPEIVKLEQLIVHAAAAPVGRFATSNPLLNRIHELVRWAQRSNMVSILTDCPHREKLGWIEQYHLNGPSLRYEFDAARIYSKAMCDLAAGQTAEGLVPNITPEYTRFEGSFRAATEWGAAFIQIPWQQYLFTGDASLLQTYYPAMQRYFAWLETRAHDDIISDGLGDWYDYAPNTGKRANLTPSPITATAYFHEDARLLARIAERLGLTADAQRYAARAEQIRRAYVTRFRREADGLYGTASQASLALPLALELAEPADREPLLAALIADIEQRGYPTAGAIGFRSVLRALAEAGRSDVVYRLINRDDQPGYGYQLRHGLTALAESWHATREASHNHFILGPIIEWFYQDLAGIAADPDQPGFANTIIRPQPVGDLTWVDASYESPHGRIAVRWEREGETFRLAVTIPCNTTATVFVPARDDAHVEASGQLAEQSRDVTLLRRESDRAVYFIGSGEYRFTSHWNPTTP